MKYLSLVLWIAAAQAAGAIGSFFTASGVKTWYVDLVKPVWNPPSWLFGPVWITLYTLMGIAAYVVYKNKATGGAKTALIVFGVHLVLNSLWSILFFGLKNPGLAFAEILVLLAMIVITMFLFWRINTWAGALLVPYLLWVAFATYLNHTLWQLNL